ncbi:MAG: FtsW/RodA/SpoVE family cell cycle protein [Candidatus Paceibacterota bacterium]|jgi:rod shape determining protein RodA
MIEKFLAKNFFNRMDWVLLVATLPIVGAGLVTMSSFVETDKLFDKQLVWLLFSLLVFFIFAKIDWRLLNRADVLAALFILACVVLASLFAVGRIRGIKGWFSLGVISIQPVDFTKIVLILVLAKYFSRRHVEIADFKHIIISGIYALIPFSLVFFQPDFGSAAIIFLIWLGMILVSGVSKKHLLYVFLTAVSVVIFLWFFVFLPYQKERIVSFLNPTRDIQGAGYNAFQSQVAVGSGMLLGKGVGYGTQSRLKFLPEYQTDFIFAAFAEEWGFVGVLAVFFFFAIIIYRILANSFVSGNNFGVLFGVGLAIMLASHFAINIGMNMGILPVTGITLPFMSYGGSHLLAEYAGLGILVGLRQNARAVHRDDIRNEFLGLEV